MIVIGCQQDWTANSLKWVDKIPNDKLSQPSIYNFKLVLKLNLLRHHHHQHQDNTKSSWSAWSSSGIKLPRYSWEFKLVSNYRGTHGADHRKTNQPTKDELDLSKLIFGFLYVVTWICQLLWDPCGRPLEDKPTKQRWIDGAGYDVTSANNKRNHLRRTWSKHMIWRELRRYDNGMHIAHRPISVTTASAAFLQFDWKLLRQFPIMKGKGLFASVVTPQSYSILSGMGCISSILLKVAMPVSDYGKMLDTSSFCCNFSILFNFKWHGLHFFNSLESCQFPIMRGIVRATKPYASASKIYKYSYLM